jgi:hypothetical protein
MAYVEKLNNQQRLIAKIVRRYARPSLKQGTRSTTARLEPVGDEPASLGALSARPTPRLHVALQSGIGTRPRFYLDRADHLRSSAAWRWGWFRHDYFLVCGWWDDDDWPAGSQHRFDERYRTCGGHRFRRAKRRAKRRDRWRRGNRRCQGRGRCLRNAAAAQGGRNGDC